MAGFTAGKISSVVWSATSQPFSQADFKHKTEIVDTTNMTSAGFQTNLDGITQVDMTATGPYDGALGLTQGETISVTYATGGGGPSFTVPFRNSEIGFSVRVRGGAFECSVSMTSNGSYSVSF